MTSAIESDYIQQTRPYSQSELRDTRSALFRSLRLGEKIACHDSCGHIYLTKQNGRKQKEMCETGNIDVGKCSVCWKINKTPRYLRDKAHNLALEYSNTFSNPPEFLSYQKLDLETVYYKWLYEDFK
jgi:hypothetical protein